MDKVFDNITLCDTAALDMYLHDRTMGARQARRHRGQESTWSAMYGQKADALSDLFEDNFTGTVSSFYIPTSVELQILSFMSLILVPILFIDRHGDIFPIISYHCEYSSSRLLGERG